MVIGVLILYRVVCYEGFRYIIECLKEWVFIWKEEKDVDKIRWGGIDVNNS